MAPLPGFYHDKIVLVFFKGFVSRKTVDVINTSSKGTTVGRLEVDSDVIMTLGMTHEMHITLTKHIFGGSER